MRDSVTEGLELRRVQLEVAACWCGNSRFISNDEAPVELCTGRVDGSRYWCFVTVFNLGLKEADIFAANVSLAFPAGVWWCGFLEHHVSDEIAGYEVFHSCVGVLVAFGTPMSEMSEINDGLLRLLKGKDHVRFCIEVCPPHVVNGVAVCRPVVEWVQQRIAFINMVDEISFPGGNWVFGYRGILEVLSRQFGSDVDFLAEEMRLAKQVANEMDPLYGVCFCDGTGCPCCCPGWDVSCREGFPTVELWQGFASVAQCDEDVEYEDSIK